MNKLSKIMTALLMMVCFTITNAQTPTFEWAKSAGADDADDYPVRSSDLSVDREGNTIITGNFQGDSIVFNGITLFADPAGHTESFFIAKYNPDGNIMWAKTYNNSVYTNGYAVATDMNNNIVVTGMFAGTFISGADTLIDTESTSIFIAKYDPSGNVIWTKKVANAGIPSYTIASSIAIDSKDTTGSIYISGYFDTDSIIFDHIAVANSGPYGNWDLFVAKYNANGNAAWGTAIGGADYDEVPGRITVEGNNVLVTGGFYSPAITIGGTTLINSDASGASSDLFIAKYDRDGNAVWAQSAGISGEENYGTGIATNSSGNLWVTGVYTGSMIYGGDTIISSGGFNSFLAKHDATGNVLWIKSSGGGAGDVAVDTAGNAAIVGEFGGSGISIDTIVLVNAGEADIFIAKYNTSGNVAWAISVGNQRGEFPLAGIDMDKIGNVFTAGEFQSDSLLFGGTTLFNTGWEFHPGFCNPEIFVCKISQCISSLGTTSISQHGDTLIATAAATYEWYKDGVLISGATTQTYLPTENGSYTVCSTAHGETCKICSDPYSITTVGIKDHTLTNAIAIYPNPNNGQFEIALQLNTQDNYTLELTNALGQVLYYEELKNYIGTYHKQLDETKYGAGIYLFRVKNSKEQSVKKVISF